jgi:hypothetical protein
MPKLTADYDLVLTARGRWHLTLSLDPEGPTYTVESCNLDDAARPVAFGWGRMALEQVRAQGELCRHCFPEGNLDRLGALMDAPL